MKHPITLRVDATLLQAARHRAQAENRTLTNFVETVLRRHIATVAVGLDDARLPETGRRTAKQIIAGAATGQPAKRKPAHG